MTLTRYTQVKLTTIKYNQNWNQPQVQVQYRVTTMSTESQ